MECERVRMRNFAGTFETRKGSSDTAFSICMTAHLKIRHLRK